MASDPKVHAFEDVAGHNITKDCWLIISGKVYDVTPFMHDHPGGIEVLLSATGKDATNDFDIGHSASAKHMMEKYYIGEVDATTIPPLEYLERASYNISTQPQPAASDHNINPNIKSPRDHVHVVVKKILQFLAPLLILVWSLQAFASCSKLTKANYYDHQCHI